jgi:CRP/FNR family transcriptional regulator, cyclic AMP receptor protein
MTHATSTDLAAPTNVLDRLGAEMRRRFEALAEPREFARDAVIIHEGADTPFLGVVETGRVALRLRVPELGERVTIVTIEPGDIVGSSALVRPFRATVDAVASEPTRILAVEAGLLRARLAADCELASALLPLVLESVSQRLGASWQQLLDMFAPRTGEPW